MVLMAMIPRINKNKKEIKVITSSSDESKLFNTSKS